MKRLAALALLALLTSVSFVAGGQLAEKWFPPYDTIGCLSGPTVCILGDDFQVVTPPEGDNDGSIPSTAYVDRAVGRVTPQEGGLSASSVKSYALTANPADNVSRDDLDQDQQVPLYPAADSLDVWLRANTGRTGLEFAASPLSLIESRVVNLEARERDLTVDAALATRVRIVPSSRNIAYNITGATAVPSDESGRQITVTIATASEPTVTHVIDLSSLLARGKVTRDGAPIGPTNSISIPEIDGDGTHYIGVDSSGDWFFGTTEAGVVYFVSIEDNRLDFQAAIRLSSDEAIKMPPDRLGTGTAGPGKTLLWPTQSGPAHWGVGSGGGTVSSGVTLADVDARIALPARAQNADPWDISKIPAGAVNRTAAQLLALIFPQPPATGDGAIWLNWNAARNGFVNADPPPVNNPSIDQRIAPFARLNALQNAETERVQEVFNAFTGGGWADVAGALDSVPTVGGTVSNNAQYNPTTVKATPWGLTGRVGTHHSQAYIRVRIPVAYAIPLARLRLLIGQRSTDPFVDPSPDDTQTFDMGTSQIVTHVTSDATYAYYSVGPFDKPAGQGWRIQVFSTFELNRAKLGGVGDTILPGVNNTDDGKILRVVDGEWEAGTETATLDHLPKLLVSTLETFNFSLGLDRAIRDTAPTAYSPEFDMDDAGHANGTFEFNANCALGGTLAVNTALWPNRANAGTNDRSRLYTNSIHAADLREESDFIVRSTGDLNGLNVLAIPIYTAATENGVAYIMGVKSAGNLARYYTLYDGFAGSSTPTLNCELRVVWHPHTL